MRVRLCDYCGKDIDFDSKTILSCILMKRSFFILKFDHAPAVFKEYDLCTQCANKIMNEIDKKQPTRGDTD